MPRARTDYRVPYSWLEGALRKGVSPTTALETFREAGYTTTTQTWYRLAGVARRALAGEETVASAPRSRRPTADELLPRRSGQTRAYLYNLRVHVVDRQTGEAFQLFRSVATDQRLRYGTVMDLAIGAEAFGSYPDEQDLAAVGAEVTEVWGAETGLEL